MKLSERYKWQGKGRKVLLIVVLIILGGIFIFGKRGLWQLYELHRLGETMEIRNDSLEQAMQTTSERIDALERGDSLELERVARHWGMVRPGEEMYVVKEEGDTLETLP